MIEAKIDSYNNFKLKPTNLGMLQQLLSWLSHAAEQHYMLHVPPRNPAKCKYLACQNTPIFPFKIPSQSSHTLTTTHEQPVTFRAFPSESILHNCKKKDLIYFNTTKSSNKIPFVHPYSNTQSFGNCE